MKMYLSDNVLSTCHNSLVLYFYAIGDYSAKVITEVDFDAYLNHDEYDFRLQPYNINLFKQAGVYDEFIEPVYVIKDPRLKELCGITVIPNKVVLRSDKESYITSKYNGKTKFFETKRYYLNSLIEECVHDDYDVIKHIYYGHTNKKPMRIVELTTPLDKSTNELVYSISYDTDSKSDSHTFTYNVLNKTITEEKRKNAGKDSYWHYKKKHKIKSPRLFAFSTPEFDFDNFSEGMSVFYKCFNLNSKETK